MRRLLFILLLSSFAVGQAPQSPRQALLEMLKATSPEQVDKHTPEVLLQEMAKLPPDARQRQHQSMMMLSLFMAMSPNMVQTYETGPIFAVIHDQNKYSRVELTMERDDLTGDTDVMELGFRMYKGDKLEELPFDPRLLIDMKLEKNVWKLSRIGGSASIQLDDPKVAALIAKSILEQMAKVPSGAQQPGMASPRTTFEVNVVSSLRTLNTAEVSYAATYPKNGYTCRLADLGGSLSGKSADEHGAQLINPALEGGTRYGYKMELSGCSASGYKIVAAPMQKGLGHRTYCTDETAVIRSADEGTDCWNGGKPVN